MLGDHGLWGKAVPYDAASRVPLIIAGPGVARNSVCDALVSLHDLAPTFVDYAHAAPTSEMDAINLRPLLENHTTNHRQAIVAGLNDWRMAFDGRHKLVVRPDSTPVLYDMHADPWEDENIADRQGHLVAQLQGLVHHTS